MNRKSIHSRAAWLAPLIPALLFAALYGRYLLGQSPVGGDVVNQYLPYQELARNAVRGGSLPLWNSFTFLGRPLMADIQVGVMYPPNWLHWLLPLPVSFALVLALHGAWMMLGCWRLGRAWRLAPEAIALGTVLYAGAPFFMLKPGQGIILFIYVGAWWPWLGLGATRLVERPGLGRMVALALALALSLLAGSPQVTFYSWLGTLALGIVLLPGRGRGGRECLRGFGLLCGAFTIALGLTAIQTFQTYYFIQSSFERATGAGWNYVTDGSLNWRFLWLLINPGFLGDGASERAFYWGGLSDFAESCYYMPLWGLCALIPAGAALAWGGMRDGGNGVSLHRRLAWLGAISMALGLLLALGEHSLLFRVFYEFAPGFNKFRVPMRLMLFWSAGGALLCALALDAMLKIELRPGRGAGIAAGLGSAAGLAALGVTFFARIPLWRALKSPFSNFPQAVAILTQHDAAMALRVAASLAIAAGLIFAILRGGPRRRLHALGLPLLAALELGALAWPFQKTISWQKLYADFYPRSAVIEALQREHRGGAVLWMDDTQEYLHDQNQPETSANRLIMQGLAQARGYDPVNARWIGLWFNLLAGRAPNENPGGFMFVLKIARPAWLTLMGVETVMSYAPLEGMPGLKLAARFDFPPDPEVPGAEPSRLTLWRNEWFKGRAFAAPSAPTALRWEDALIQSAKLAENRSTSPTAALVYDDGTGLLRRFGELAGGVDARWRIENVAAGANGFRYRVDYPASAMLCLAQSAYNGWNVFVDGEPKPLRDYCGAFVVAAIPQGKHDVEFRYTPPGFRMGRNVSLLTLLGLLLLALRGRGRAGVSDVWNNSPLLKKF